jgi:hypothetical protein
MSNKLNKFTDYEEDEYITDKRNKRRQSDRRKKKRMKNALRNLNVYELQNLEEQDEYL